MSDVSLVMAFVAGILSFLSPCLLPLIPGYISFISGVSFEKLQEKDKTKDMVRKIGISSLFFVLGFSSIFILLGASTSFIGRFLVEYLKVFTRIAGILIIILGLNILGVFRIGWFRGGKDVSQSKTPKNLWEALLVGMAFAFAWTPCVGPILAGILTLAATQSTVHAGVYLLGVYSLGLGIPFLLTGLFTGLFTSFLSRYRQFIRWGEIFSGIFLIVMGILVFTNNLVSVLKFIPPLFYKFAK